MNITNIQDVNKPLSANVESSEFIGGDGAVIAPGPALFSQLPAGGSESLDVIGLVQSMGINSSKGTTTVGELGTMKQYLISMRGRKSWSFARLTTEMSNALRALYSYHLKLHEGEYKEGINYPNGPIWENLEHPLFKKSIGISLSYYDGEPGQRNLVARVYLENCVVAAIGGSGTQGQKGTLDNLVLQWGNLVYEKIKVEEVDNG